jgi:hypothetical protein
MKLLKHILVAVALLVMALPCVHAAHYGHHHDEGVELCEIAAEPCCACHSREQQPCTDNVEIQLDRTPDAATIEQASSPTLLYILPEAKPALKKAILPPPGVLATLKTVQLLI